MSHNLVEATPGAFAFPLLIKTLLHSGLRAAPEQEIVYADRLRYDYGSFTAGSARLPTR